jgi:hypothetical protein
MTTAATEEKELIDKFEFHRGGLAVQERKFCARVIKFIQYILPIELVAQCERAQGLIFGTQTLTSIIVGKKGKGYVTRDNFLAIAEFCNYVTKATMVVGNLVNSSKALRKVKLWENEFSIAKKLKYVTTGPVNPETLKTSVEEHFRKTAATLVVLMMDSGGYKDYSATMRSLTKEYDNLYIIKMVLVGSYSIRILRAYRGNVSTVNNHKFSSRWKTVKRKGWEYARQNQEEVLGGLFEEFTK